MLINLHTVLDMGMPSLLASNTVVAALLSTVKPLKATTKKNQICYTPD